HRRPTVCAAKGPCWHVTPNVVRPCVLSKGNDGIKYPTSSDRVCCMRVMMTCHVDVVPPCVLLKGDDSIDMPNVIRPCGDDVITTTNVVRLCVLHNCDDGMPLPTSSVRICSPKVMMACHF
ncbi:hypothetical protein EJD97_016477, partial [Solanum chilense]